MAACRYHAEGRRELQISRNGAQDRVGKRRGPDGNEGAVRSGLQESNLDHRQPAALDRREQIRRNMALALSGIIGYYGRSTVITWEDCQSIEQG